MTIRRASVLSGIRFETLLLVTLAIGCGSSTTNNNSAGNASGGANATTGGAPGVGGGAIATGGSVFVATGGNLNATGGALTVATGGSVTTETGGDATTTDTGGSNNNGAGGSDGSTGGTATSGTGGSSTVDCNPPVTTQCTGTVPPAALISDFTATTSGTPPVTSTPVFGTWGQPVYGGTFIYPTSTPACGTTNVSPYPLTETVTGGNWNIQGTVGTYTGLGFWWNCNTGTTAAPTYAGICTIDASAYTGISFTISGTIGPVSTGTGTVGLTIQVSTPSTTAPAKNSDGTPATDSAGNPKPNCGTCTGTTCGTNVAVPVTTTASTVSFTWAQLGVTTSNAITSISFGLTDPCSLNNGYATTPCTPTTYPVNITIDNIQFTTT